MTWMDWTLIVVFLAGIFYAGGYFYKWVGTPDDFYVAGRQITPFLLAATITATNVNLYSFVGQAGVAYKHGISILWQTWTGNMALVFSGLFVIPILRRLKVRTVPEFLELRYNKAVRSLVGILWIFRLAFWLGVVLYTAVVAAQAITGIQSFTLWVVVFSVIAVAYTSLGGMWSVALTDALQFILMLLGALILLPLAMKAVGWMPGLLAQTPPHHLDLVVKDGPYNWQFMLAIFILGIEWASVDQGLMQRAFGAQDTRTVAKGLVLAGIITTPFALLWNLPGLAATVLYPHLSNADSAVPTMIHGLLPPIVLGIVVCGLLASQMSTIDSNLNGVATLYTNDIYASLFNRKSTQRDILRTVRWMTLVTGLFMIGFSYLVPRLGGAVSAYLTVIAIMDMPLFIIAIFYGLLWKRASSWGAIGGYMTGALAGGLAKFAYGLDFNKATFISAGAALVATPVFSWLSKPVASEKIVRIWKARQISEEEIEKNAVYHIWPKSVGGKMSLLVLAAGLLFFLAGALMGSRALPVASLVAVSGMLLYFLGGLVRLFFD